MTHEELREILNADIPSPNSPDPAWSYYEIHSHLTKFRTSIDDLIKFISQHESRTDEVDTAVSLRLDQLSDEFEDILI